MRSVIALSFLVLSSRTISAQPLCDFLFRDSLHVETVADTVTIWDSAACGYCSSRFVPSVTLSADSIYIVQTDTASMRTTCNCLFDLKTSIIGLPTGIYTVTLYRDFGRGLNFIRSIQLQHTAGGAETLSWNSFQSGCLSSVPSERFIELPTQFALQQNYPNPFNPNTTVRFQIPVTEFVTIKVFDVLGRDVQTLLQQTASPGIYMLNFQAGPHLASGVYFCQMVAGSFVQTNVMVLMK